MPKEGMSTGKKVGLGVFIGVGSLIIIAAVFMLVWLFSAMQSSSPRALTANFNDFLSMYEENQADRDLPNGFSVTNANCRIDRDGGTYSISFNINNDSDTQKDVGYQCYYNEEYTAAKALGNATAFVSVPNDGSLTIHSGESETVSTNGILDKSLSEEQTSAQFDYIYLEINSGNQTGRVMIPLTIN